MSFSYTLIETPAGVGLFTFNESYSDASDMTAANIVTDAP